MTRRHTSILQAFALCLLLLGGGTGASAQQQYDQQHRFFIGRLITIADSGEIANKPISAFMREEKISIKGGTINDLRELYFDTTAFMEVTLVNGKRYAVSFYREDQRAITVSYPADYKLILGITMIEAEDQLPDAIRMTPLPPTDTLLLSESLLQQIGQSPVYMLDGGSYMIPELTANRYFVCEEEVGYQLLYSEDLPLETLANLVTGTELQDSINLNILLIKYGYRTETFTVPLRQWIAYCLNTGCQPYFGVISRSDQRIVGELVMHNENMGYAHVMKISLNPAILAEGKGTAKARLNSYVPLFNLKSLFSTNEYK